MLSLWQKSGTNFMVRDKFKNPLNLSDNLTNKFFTLTFIEYTTFVRVIYYPKYSELFSKECKMSDRVNMMSHLFMMYINDVIKPT